MWAVQCQVSNFASDPRRSPTSVRKRLARRRRASSACICRARGGRGYWLTTSRGQLALCTRKTSIGEQGLSASCYCHVELSQNHLHVQNLRSLHQSSYVSKRDQFHLQSHSTRYLPHGQGVPGASSTGKSTHPEVCHGTRWRNTSSLTTYFFVFTSILFPIYTLVFLAFPFLVIFQPNRCKDFFSSFFTSPFERANASRDYILWSLSLRNFLDAPLYRLRF